MWNTVQCAVQGRGHIRSGIPCQDKTCVSCINGVSVIALADGAGSAHLSHYGAEAVTEYICACLSENFDKYYEEADGIAVKKEMTSGILTCVLDRASELECRPEELASTLLCVAIKDNRFILLHIGDGVIGYLKNNELRIASQPENGEFANTTVFTTSQDVLFHVRLIKGILGAISGFVLMSDGTEASLYDKKNNVLAPAIKRLMQYMVLLPPQSVEEQLKLDFESVIIMSTSDDCSLALMVNDQGTLHNYTALSQEEKRIFFRIPSNCVKRILRRYDVIFRWLQSGRSSAEIATKIHLKPKYTRKTLSRLCQMGLLEQKGMMYKSRIVILEEDAEVP